MIKVGIVSLGCPKNLVDSEVMLGHLARAGYKHTPHAAEADVIVVNTCAFIEPAKRESIETILEMAEYKKKGAARKLVVTGCLAERYRQEIRREIPEVDYVIGPQELEQVIAACALDSKRPASAMPRSSPGAFAPRVLSTPFYSAYLKIAEGCDHPCSFCAIPHMRGRFRSREKGSLIHEAESLIRQGVREITLVGQDTTGYGEDLGLRDGLATLLRELNQLPDLVWLRFLYCYPNRVSDALLDAVAGNGKVCKYLDIPYQHASARVLRSMRRGSSGRYFLQQIKNIRTAIPEVTLRTSMIVGFPGESEEGFQELLNFVAEAQFDHLGVFLYSNEEGTASYSLPGQVPARVAHDRQRKLLALQRRISRRKLRPLVGRTFPVLVEGRSSETELLYQGRMASQSPEIDGQVLINDFVGPEPRAGEFRWATITSASDYDLVARLEERWLAVARQPSRGESTSRLIHLRVPPSSLSKQGYAVPNL